MTAQESASTWQLQRWQVRGLVAGPALPDDAIQLTEHCRISKVSEELSDRLMQRIAQRWPDPNRFSEAAGNPELLSIEMPMMTLARSQHQLSIVVRARNAERALDTGMKEAGEALAALTLAVGLQKYRFCPAIVNRLHGGGRVDTTDYVTSGLGAFTIYEDAVLLPSTVAYAKTLLREGKKDKVLSRAFGFLPSGDPAILKAALSNCFLALESVSEAVTKPWRKQNKADTLKEQEKIADALREKLSHTADAAQKVDEVRKAHKELQRADLYFQDLKLEAAGRALGVEERFISLAQELNKLRNRKLGHAGSATDEEINAWIYAPEDDRVADDQSHFGKAELTAMAYLKAYLDYIHDTRT